MHGLTASMKTEVAKFLSDSLHFKVVRTDDFRLELAEEMGIDFTSVEAMKTHNEIVYNKTFHELSKHISNNYTCILDSTSRSYDFRERIYDLCEQKNLSPIMLRCYCRYGLSKFRIDNYRKNSFDLIGSNTEEHLLFTLSDYEFPSFTEPCSIVEFNSGILKTKSAKVKTADEILVNKILSLDVSTLHHFDWLYDDGFDKIQKSKVEEYQKRLNSIPKVTEGLEKIILDFNEGTNRVEKLKVLEKKHNHEIQQNMDVIERYLEEILREIKNTSKAKGLTEELMTGASGSMLASIIQNISMRIPELYQYIVTLP